MYKLTILHRTKEIIKHKIKADQTKSDFLQSQLPQKLIGRMTFMIGIFVQEKKNSLNNNISFLDVNECDAGSHSCHTHATCTNTEGSYTCACNNGYSGDGTTCSG